MPPTTLPNVAPAMKQRNVGPTPRLRLLAPNVTLPGCFAAVVLEAPFCTCCTAIRSTGRAGRGPLAPDMRQGKSRRSARCGSDSSRIGCGELALSAERARLASPNSVAPKSLLFKHKVGLLNCLYGGDPGSIVVVLPYKSYAGTPLRLCV